MIPYAAMFHPPTFHHRFYLNRISPLLLDIIHALSAMFCTDPTFLSTYSIDTPAHSRGEPFVDRAHRSARHMLDQRSNWSEEETRLNRGTWEETEFVQSLYLLSVYFTTSRQTQRTLGSFYLDSALSILRPTSAATLPPPASHLGLSNTEYLTMMEARHRSFWLCVLSDLSSMGSNSISNFNSGGRTKRRVADHELYNIPLPGSEAGWVRWGGTGSGGREMGRRDGMAIGTGNWLGEEGQVGELGYALRIVSVFGCSPRTE